METLRSLVGRLTRVEIVIGLAIAALMLVLVIIEPNILEAPFENANTLLFTFGGTALAALALLAMLRLGVPPLVRILVLVAPFALVNWWLISPYFIDEVADDDFTTSISAQLDAAGSDSEDAATTTSNAPTTTEAAAPDDGSTTTSETAVESTTTTTTTAAPDVPVLLGAGSFVGLAGHDGTGDAGLFRNPDGSFVLRFENFDIENGPDLEVYFVPGADQVSLPEGSIHLGALKGNIGDQNYDLPEGTELLPGPYTALVWCEAFSVEFVGATIEI